MTEPASGRLVSIPGGPTAARQRPVPPARALDRARPPRRSARQRSLRRRARLRPRRPRAAVINGRRRQLTIVGVALSPEYIYSIRPGELIPTIDGSASSGWSRQRWRRPSTWRAGSTMSSLALAPGRLACRRHRRSRSHARAVWRARRDPARAAALALVARERAGTASELRRAAAAHLHAGRGVHPERRAHARPRAAAPANRGAQGPRLQQHRARVALPQVGAGHRSDRCDHRHHRRERCWAAC